MMCEGAVSHITFRGNARQDIFADDSVLGVRSGSAVSYLIRTVKAHEDKRRRDALKKAQLN